MPASWEGRMRAWILVLMCVVAAGVGTTLLIAQGPPPQHGSVLIPDTSIERREDMGIRAHTNHVIQFRPEFVGTSPSGETPASIRSVYNIPSTGGSGIIAIVDAYDYPTAENDLNVFSSTFGLPPCTTANGCFQKVFAAGRKPRTNCGWAQEAALDIEWAHAMAPNAKIVLVEAASNRFSDLFQAVDVASNIVSQNGGVGEVSMSWGGSGGGPSQYESRPPYQDGISAIVGTQRGAPDFSFDADPNSGVSVYDSTPCQGFSGWLVFGGTSVSSPSLAGIVNLAGHFHGNSATELSIIYSNLGNASDFRDIVSGTAGSFNATTGWDFVTGVGSNQGLNGK